MNDQRIEIGQSTERAMSQVARDRTRRSILGQHVFTMMETQGMVCCMFIRRF